MFRAILNFNADVSAARRPARLARTS